MPKGVFIREKRDLRNSNTGKWMGATFGDNNQLEVIATHGYNKCTVVCHICKLDEELHGTATYEVYDGNIRKGKMPCGCSKTVKWTDKQYDVLCRRKAQDKGLEYRGRVGDKILSKSNILMYCPIHDYE